MRPRTLAEVALLTAGGDSFDRCLANFLDGFYAAPCAAAFADTPVLLGPQFGDTGRVQDAYLAATAEELCRRFNFSPPAWVAAESRRLASPLLRHPAGRGACGPPPRKPAGLPLAQFVRERKRPLASLIRLFPSRRDLRPRVLKAEDAVEHRGAGTAFLHVSDKITDALELAPPARRHPRHRRLHLALC